MQRISREVRSYFSQYQILGLTDGKELLGPKFTSVSESKAPFRFRPSVIPMGPIYIRDPLTRVT